MAGAAEPCSRSFAGDCGRLEGVSLWREAVVDIFEDLLRMSQVERFELTQRRRGAEALPAKVV